MRNEMWEARLEELRAWKSRKFLVPPAENPRLSKWLIKQRALHNAGQLPPERERRLEELGVPWEPVGQYTDLWEERFKELLAFKKKFGHCNIPARWKENIQLGTWVANLRAFHRRGKLSGERITRLDAIGFDWMSAMLRKSA